MLKEHREERERGKGEEKRKYRRDRGKGNSYMPVLEPENDSFFAIYQFYYQLTEPF